LTNIMCMRLWFLNLDYFHVHIYMLLRWGKWSFCPFYVHKILNNRCGIISTRQVPNGYGYPLGMGAGKVLYQWVCVGSEIP
jgi:hypothetical protein